MLASMSERNREIVRSLGQRNGTKEAHLVNVGERSRNSKPLKSRKMLTNERRLV